MFGNDHVQLGISYARCPSQSVGAIESGKAIMRMKLPTLSMRLGKFHFLLFRSFRNRGKELGLTRSGKIFLKTDQQSGSQDNWIACFISEYRRDKLNRRVPGVQKRRDQGMHGRRIFSRRG